MDMHFEGVVFQSHAAELARRVERPWPPFAVLDVRPAAEFARRSLPGARSFDPADPAGLPEGTTVETEFFVIGRDPDDGGVRRATDILRQAGARRVVEIPGGLREWMQLGLPVAAGDPRLAAA